VHRPLPLGPRRPKADEHDQSEVPGPATVEGGPEAIGGLAHARPDHSRCSSLCKVRGPGTSAGRTSRTSSLAEGQGVTKVATSPRTPRASTLRLS
jgi:hypothetical protein